MKNTSSEIAFSKRVILSASLFSFIYAVVRYNIFGSVPWHDLPIYVLNKVTSFAALLLLALNFSLNPLRKLGFSISDKWMNSRKLIGISGFIYAFIHVLMSLSILNPHYFSAFFLNDDSLTLKGNLSLFGGITSFALIWIYKTRFSKKSKKEPQTDVFITSKGFLLVTLLLIGTHVFFLGANNWFVVGNWLGGIPPISLISFLIFSLTFLINLIGRK